MNQKTLTEKNLSEMRLNIGRQKVLEEYNPKLVISKAYKPERSPRNFEKFTKRGE